MRVPRCADLVPEPIQREPHAVAADAHQERDFQQETHSRPTIVTMARIQFAARPLPSRGIMKRRCAPLNGAWAPVARRRAHVVNGPC